MDTFFFCKNQTQFSLRISFESELLLSRSAFSRLRPPENFFVISPNFDLTIAFGTEIPQNIWEHISKPIHVIDSAAYLLCI